MRTDIVLKRDAVLINTTRNTKIASEARLCSSILSKAKGLMFSKKLDDEALIFDFNNERLISLHMLFVFFPIDVVLLDENKKVVELKEKLRPFTFYASKSKARYVIETASGKIRETGTKLGDKLGFQLY